MANDMTQLSIAERFDHLLAILGSERFLKMQGLGNEVPFFICPYAPQDGVEMDRIGRQLISQLKRNGVRVLKINLYDLSIQLLQQRGIWERILEVEPTISKNELKELLQNVLDPEAHLIPAIAQRIAAEDYDILFLTGVGEVFPYIRSHNVLNNLQSVAKAHPTVMFFPGEYTHSDDVGSALVLFGRLEDDRYYRAFNIYDYEI
jgi:bacteriophage exclusion system BrxB-like protein